MSLKTLQELFSHLLTQPMEVPLSQNSCFFIRPSKSLSSQERLEIYRKQYWGRLIQAMEKIFPSVASYLGEKKFQKEFAVPYLTDFPPNHWALRYLGKNIESWLSSKNTLDSLTYELACVDYAYQKALWTSENTNKISELKNPETLLATPLSLQPYLSLIEASENIMEIRGSLIKKNANPPLQKREKAFFIFYRNSNQEPCWKKVSYNQFALLKNFQKGDSIQNALKNGAKYIPDPLKIPFWFKEWTAHQWFIFS